jgi:hypothetical protein
MGNFKDYGNDCAKDLYMIIELSKKGGHFKELENEDWFI